MKCEMVYNVYFVNEYGNLELAVFTSLEKIANWTKETSATIHNVEERMVYYEN